MEQAVVYTETVVHAPPQLYADEAPYQLAIIEKVGGQRLTVRIDDTGGRVAIGDRVEFVENRGSVAYFRRLSGFKGQP